MESGAMLRCSHRTTLSAEPEIVQGALKNLLELGEVLGEHTSYTDERSQTGTPEGIFSLHKLVV